MRKDAVDKRLCSRCVGERYLKSKVIATGERSSCDYCGKVGKTLSLVDLCENHIRGALERHYVRTPTGPPEGEEFLYRDSVVGWDRPGEPAVDAIGYAAGLAPEAAEDVRAVLEANTFTSPDEYFDGDGEGEFSEESQYEEITADSADFDREWQRFQNTLKTNTRLFNSEAKAVLESIFAELDGLATRGGRKVVVSAGPGEALSALYRARVFQSDSKLEEALKRPDRELGPPPPPVAVAGRMNSRGIAVFYGASHPQVAVAEIRPPVGSRVLVGRFEIIRPLKLLDLLALRSIFVKGSIFDPSYLPRLKKAAFLASLSVRITRPVMPDDEIFEYLVTQAISDYLANLSEPNLDGIIYRSPQHGASKRNVVLFHKAAAVKSLDVPPGTLISAHLFEHDDEEVRPDYVVFEMRPAPQEAGDSQSTFRILEPSENLSRSEERRDAALKIDIASLRVYHVERAQYRTTVFETRRHQSQASRGLKQRP